MRIYYIRHAQSYNNALLETTRSRTGRMADPDLTTIGRQQTEILANYIFEQQESLRIDTLYCSLMQRAIQTALPIASLLGLSLHGLVDSHESGGIYLEDDVTKEPVGLPGTPPEELRAKYPDLILPDDLNEAGWWSRPWESVEERILRAKRLAAALREKHGGPNHVVALVSHQGFFNHLFFALLGTSRPSDFWFTLNNASLTCLDLTDNSVNAVFINRMEHIRRELWTW